MRLSEFFRRIISSAFKSLLFLSSYLPLFLILLLQNYNNYIILIILLLLIAFPLITLKKFLIDALSIEPNFNITISKIFPKGRESMSYIVGYIIPFLSLNIDLLNNNDALNIINLLSLIILFFVIGNIYISSNLYYINPVLGLFYSINEIEDNMGNRIFVICRKKERIKFNTTIATREMTQGIYFFNKQKETFGFHFK